MSVSKEKHCPSFSQVLQKWIFIGFPSTVPPNRLSSTHSSVRQDVMGLDSDLVCVGPRLSCNQIFGLMTSPPPSSQPAPVATSSQPSRAIYGSGPSVHRNTPFPPTPLSSFAQIIQRSAMMRMRSKKTTRALWKCETKRVWGRLVFTPGNAITPSRNSNLVSQTQFVFRPGEEI